MTPWMQTYTGRAFPLVDTKPGDIDPYDMAYHLAHINRFSGAAGAISVAQHSIAVADVLPQDLRLYGLLHDAHEYAMGDITTPVQRALEVFGGPQVHCAFGALKRTLDKAIFEWAGLPPMPESVAEMVHVADKRVMLTEKRDLLVREPQSWGFYGLEPLPGRIIPWDADTAEDEFLRELGKYGLTKRFV